MIDVCGTASIRQEVFEQGITKQNCREKLKRVSFFHRNENCDYGAEMNLSCAIVGVIRANVYQYIDYEAILINQR